MPQGDRTGPQGRGPKTGRGLGRCNPKGVPAATRDQPGTGSGKGKGGGRGQDRGQSGGSGRGR
jgi:uncharacterized protein DUF5320